MIVNRRRYMGGGSADEIIMTSTSNPEVLAVCYAKGWCAHSGYMTKAEAEAVTSIGNGINSAFYQNTSITHFNEFQYFGVSSLGARNFQGCTNLKSIVLPDAISTISQYCFNGCTNLETLTKNVVTSISSEGMRNCEKLTSYTFDSALSSIGSYAFAGCSVINFTNDLPSGLTSLGTAAFQSTGFTGHLTIPNSISSVPQKLFQGANITSVTLPSTCTEISHYAFYNAKQMQSLTVLAVTPPTITSSTFTGMTGTIYVPAASVSDYQTAWSSLSSRIQAIS